MNARKNIINTLYRKYGKFGMDKAAIAQLVDSGVKQGLSYTAVYNGLRAVMGKEFGVRELFTAADVVECLGCTQEEAERQVEQLSREHPETVITYPESSQTVGFTSVNNYFKQ